MPRIRSRPEVYTDSSGVVAIPARIWPEGQAIVPPGTGNRRGDPLGQATEFARQGNFPDCVDWGVLEETVSATLNS